MKPQTLIWFRRDLRLQDNPALAKGIARGKVLPVYILDEVNSGDWMPGEASRWWLHHSLQQLNKSLKNKLWVFAGNPEDVLGRLISEHQISAVYWNRCYEPWQVCRDRQIKTSLQSSGIDVQSFNASLFLEPWTNLKKDGTPYRVFTPYYRNGRANLDCPETIRLDPDRVDAIACTQSGEQIDSLKLLPANNWYQKVESLWVPGESSANKRLESFIHSGIENYKDGRDIPSLNAVSRLSPYLHFGEISPRQVLSNVQQATNGAQQEPQLEHFQKELAWREFSYSLLYHFPEITNQNLNRKFDNFPWLEDEKFLKQWQQGETGFPLVDAGMRELWNTGYMHNRVRMVVASFLVKNLLIPWQSGARWFWDCLLDADLANNTCSWQWVAGCGADAAPYFRIFNPVTQSQKFDPCGAYIRKHIPALRACPDKYIHDPSAAPQHALAEAGIKLNRDYPESIVSLKDTRERALNAYKALALA